MKPEKHGAKMQTFSITLPGATSVLLAGDFTHGRGGPIPMKKSGPGLWQVSVALPPGTHRYRFIVDGETRDNLECIVPVPATAGTPAR